MEIVLDVLWMSFFVHPKLGLFITVWGILSFYAWIMSMEWMGFNKRLWVSCPRVAKQMRREVAWQRFCLFVVVELVMSLLGTYIAATNLAYLV